MALRCLLLIACMLLTASPALAAEARAHLIIEIAADGYVSITQKWDGIHELDRLVYDTGTDELGVLEAPVHEGHSELSYSSSELLRRDGDRLRLIIARLDYLGNWLDFDISVRYPAGLSFINADPEPSFMNSDAGGLMWSILDQRELILTASFSGDLSGASGREGQSSSMSEAELRQRSAVNREADNPEVSRDADNSSEVSRDADNSPEVSRDADNSPDADNYPKVSRDADNTSNDSTPPASTSANDGSRMQRPGDPELSRDADNSPGADNTPAPRSGQSSSDLLLDGDPLLLEFRMLINAAAREGKADEDFLQALEKLLLKFYYLLDALDATDEYEP